VGFCIVWQIPCRRLWNAKVMMITVKGRQKEGAVYVLGFFHWGPPFDMLLYGIPVGVWISLCFRGQRDLHRPKHIGIDSQNTLRVSWVFAFSCYTPKLNWLKRALYHNNKVHNTLVHKKVLGSPVSLSSPISCFSHF
jgi:hypothetical protein